MAKAINLQNWLTYPTLGDWSDLSLHTMNARPVRLGAGELGFSVRHGLQGGGSELSWHIAGIGHLTGWTPVPLFFDHEIAFFFAGETTLKPTETSYQPFVDEPR